MTLKYRLVRWLINYAKKTPYTHLEGYQERYWVIRPRWWFPFRIRVHKILRSDLERDMHDHPAANFSLVLKGQYLEVFPRKQSQDYWQDKFRPSQSRVIRRAGDVVFRWGHTRHRLVLNNGECWSLFVMLPRYREWGFYTDDGWVNHKDYPATQKYVTDLPT